MGRETSPVTTTPEGRCYGKGDIPCHNHSRGEVLWEGRHPLSQPLPRGGVMGRETSPVTTTPEGRCYGKGDIPCHNHSREEVLWEGRHPLPQPLPRGGVMGRETSPATTPSKHKVHNFGDIQKAFAYLKHDYATLQVILTSFSELIMSYEMSSCSGLKYLKHDGTVPTCFNQSKASISFDYIA